MTAPVEGKPAAEMADALYAEGRRLREAGHTDFGDAVMRVGGFFWAVAIKGRERALEALSRGARQ